MRRRCLRRGQLRRNDCAAFGQRTGVEPRHGGEFARLVRQAEERAAALLRDHREALDTLAELLTTRETVDGPVVLDVLRQQRPDGHDPRRGREKPTSPP